MPNVILRSALFGVTRQRTRPPCERKTIHAQSGYSIIYTGACLNQSDLDVWEAVLHLIQQHALGGDVQVTGYQMLKLLDQTDTGKNRGNLHRHLSRLSATSLEIKTGSYSYEGSLIDEVQRDSVTRQYRIRVNVAIHRLFSRGQYTLLERGVRKALVGKPLAKWLHGYYSSHAEPFRVSTKFLHKLCGSETEALWKFRQTLRASFKHLEAAYLGNGQSFAYEICDEMVDVSKQASASQLRHLSKAKGRKKCRSDR